MSLSDPSLSNIQFTKCNSLNDIRSSTKASKIELFPEARPKLEGLKLINDIEVFKEDSNPLLAFCLAAFVKFFRNFNFYMFT